MHLGIHCEAFLLRRPSDAAQDLIHFERIVGRREFSPHMHQANGDATAIQLSEGVPQTRLGREEERQGMCGWL